MLDKIKTAYTLWFLFLQKIPKLHRYTLGARIDKLWIEIIEAVAFAGFLTKIEKIVYVRLAVRKLDTIKILMMVLWETKSLNTKQYITISEKIDEIGKMLGGWHGQLQKQNSPVKTREK